MDANFNDITNAIALIYKELFGTSINNNQPTVYKLNPCYQI